MKVQNLGDDPARLLRRGQDLLTREDFAKASEVLNLAIFIQPDLIEGYRQLAWVYSRQRVQAGIQTVAGEDPRKTLGIARDKPRIAIGSSCHPKLRKLT